MEKRVQALTLEEVSRVKDYLAARKKYRDLALFTLGCNNGLRMVDLLRLKVGQVRRMKPGDTILIKESKCPENIPLQTFRKI